MITHELADGCFPRDERRKLRLRIVTDVEGGLSVEALTDSGEPLGGIMLDYFDDRLQGIVYNAQEDHLVRADICTTGVAKQRRTSQEAT